MRTRSQMLSPGGLVSLDDNNVARRTRSTRSNSQQPAATEEQPAPRPKTTRATKKTTSTTTKKTTNKTQSRKTTTAKRTTRQTARKTSQSTSDENEQSQIKESENIEPTAIQAEAKPRAPSDNPNSHTTVPSKETGLTTQEDRKRRRSTNEDDTDADNEGGPITPAANKRRNLGVPGNTPYSYATPLPRRVTANITPFSERIRRRNAENQGRIYRTSLRISQYLAQEDADRQAFETPASGTDFTFTEPFPSFEDNEPHQEQKTQESAQEPTTPERPASRWGLSGLLSVPRSLSRLLPTFGRSPERNETQVPAEPATEPVNRTQPKAPVPSTSTASPTPKSKEPVLERQRDLSFSLFPPPLDKSRYLDDLRKPNPKPLQPLASAATSEAPESSADTSKPKDSAESTTEAGVLKGSKVVSEESNTSTPKQKKRKRAPSPDVIPNPPGCSYGMYEEYFVISDSDEDSDNEDEPARPQTEPKQQDPRGKSAVRSALRSERPATKKVRFDASPQDTPSKLRMKPRATDPYTGQHFVGMNSPGESSNSSAPASPAPASQAEQPSVYPDPRSRPGFVPNRDGTFETPYSDTSSEASDDDAPASGFVPNRDGTFETPYSDTSSEASDSEDPAPGFQAPFPPSTPAKVEDVALARVRSQAEKYKPKTPSGLRTASRYSSPLTIATPDTIPASVTRPESASEPEDFGDDQFARDAQWLYENCPTGDLSELVWPEAESYVDMGFSAEAVRIANEIWDPSVVDHAYDNIWTPGLEAFRREMETGSFQAALA
ncbi:uncharacterized protein BO97DRAFT_355824 [Aspergillus homomorphus CBS 101889]|uniref:Uncharacterized protein n=1 Tax=Aspergillus homomorphus (strain CBS 101889) TaxID=1450537 RepID=A0A395HKF9_ASPHC|nr:hypothetical protein BO97DRAFT_355824 [Aspergillus homomorphus CBS 101889]RAL07695.1 hypothetical protein BO97DRAFT_355824 [Aspergillus homomorphus CBS 101889]